MLFVFPGADSCMGRFPFDSQAKTIEATVPDRNLIIVWLPNKSGITMKKVLLQQVACTIWRASSCLFIDDKSQNNVAC